MDLNRVDVIVQFTRGTTTVWNNPSVPVPNGAIVIDTANKIIKEGDGATLFANLPVCLNYNFHADTSGALTPEGDNVGAIVIADDTSYSPSGIQLENLINEIVIKNTTSAGQQDRINISTLNNVVDPPAEGTIDGTIVICQDGKYIPGDKTLAQLIADLSAQANNINASMHITDLEWFTDEALSNQVVDPNQISELSSYWCRVSGFHDNCELKNVDFGLATTTEGITVTSDQEEVASAIIIALTESDRADYFYGNTFDSQGNIICVGTSDIDGTNCAVVIKYDSLLNIIAKKRLYVSSYREEFLRVVVDSQDNIICVGQTSGVAGGIPLALIVKFDSSLNVVFKKYVSYGGSTIKFNDVAVDSDNNIYAVGVNYADVGSGGGFIVKFSGNGTILIKKAQTFSSAAYITGIKIQGSMIYCCGYFGGSLFIMKMGLDLTVVSQQKFGGGVMYSKAIDIDGSGNIYVAGYGTSFDQVRSQNSGFLVKIANDLSNYVWSYEFYGAGVTEFNDLVIRNDQIFVSGLSVDTNYDGLIILFDLDGNIVKRKRLSGTGYERFDGISINNSGVICSGAAFNAGNTYSNYCMLNTKLDISLTANSLESSIFTDLHIIDDTYINRYAFVSPFTEPFSLTNSTSSTSATDFAPSAVDITVSHRNEVLVASRVQPATKLITATYSDSGEDKFIANTIGADGSVVAVGSTVVGDTKYALVVKFDTSFDVVARKVFGGNFSQSFNSVVTDSNNDIICVGTFQTSSGGSGEAFIVKFSSSLTDVIIQKTYGATGDDGFNDVVKDPSGNFIVVGYTTSEGSGLKDALIIKFSPTFATTYKKRYGGSGNDILTSVAIDANGNAICVGSTGSEGANVSGLVLKLDANLNIVLRKYYNSTLGTGTEFNSVIVTSANVIYCAGRVVIASGNKGLLVKLDSNLNSLGNKLYGSNIGSTEFTGVKIDSENNIFAVGKTNAEGAGNYDALIVKFSSTLTILGRKTYGTIGEDADIDCIINSSDEIVISGYSVIGGSTDAIITKIPNSLPIGLFTNKYLTDLIMSDSKLTLSEDAATVGNSTTAMADSNLILTNGSMSISNASGAIVKDITIMDAVSNVFKVQIGNIVSLESAVNVPFIVTTDDGDETLSKNIDVNVLPANIILAVYGGSNADYFYDIATDSQGNIICVGNSSSGGFGYTYCMIVKFDLELNIISSKRYDGLNYDYFSGIVIDSQDNIICVGNTNWDGAGYSSGIVVKFDSNLTIIDKKRYGGTNNDYFRDVTIDSQDNIICAGNTASEGSGSSDALIVKFNTDLTIETRKRYGGTGNDYFFGVTTDSQDNIICVGNTTSEGSGNEDALVVKFNTDLTINARKVCGNSLSESFSSVTVDSRDNIICTGYTSSFDSNNNDGLVIKFDPNLTVMTSKRLHGNAGNREEFRSITIDNQDNIICCGLTYSEGSGNADTITIKLPSNIPDGTIGCTVLSNLTLIDCILTIGDSNLTLGDSALTLSDSTLTLGDSTLTLSDNTLTLEKELIVV